MDYNMYVIRCIKPGKSDDVCVKQGYYVSSAQAKGLFTKNLKRAMLFGSLSEAKFYHKYWLMKLPTTMNRGFKAPGETTALFAVYEVELKLK